MRQLKNEKGIALITAVLLALLALIIVLLAMYFVLQATKNSARTKWYRNSLEASHGGVEVFTKDIIPQMFTGLTETALEAQFSRISLNVNSFDCLQKKLQSAPVNWVGVCAEGSTPSLEPKTNPDVQFRLRGLPLEPGFNVYAKIVDTQEGNSDISNIDYLDTGASVAGTNSTVSPQHLPALYRIEVQGERENNPQEKALLSVLYEY